MIAVGGELAGDALHFGLGDAAKVDGVEIHWPDGKVEKVALPDVDKIYTVEEDKGLSPR